jgi:hypothetical protein
MAGKKEEPAAVVNEPRTNATVYGDDLSSNLRGPTVVASGGMRSAGGGAEVGTDWAGVA